MGQAEELLQRAASTWTARPESEPHIIIDEDRRITVPDALKRIAVQGDHNIETVTFDCPRYWDDHDLSKMHIYINYMRPDKSPGSRIAENVRVDDEDDSIIHFDWTISNHVSEFKGNLSFLVCAREITPEVPAVTETIVHVELTSGLGEWRQGDNAGNIPDLYTLAYGNGMFVAVDRDHPNSPTGQGGFYYSEDGVTWNKSKSKSGATIYDIIYENNAHGKDVFIAVGEDEIYVSFDGITWSGGGQTAFESFHSIAYGNGTFVAVGPYRRSSAIYYSNDGADWTEATYKNSNYIFDCDLDMVAYCGNRFYAVGDNVALCSNDGIKWGSARLPFDNKVVALTYADDKLLAVSDSGALYYSTDGGLNWNDNIPLAPYVDIQSISYGNGMLVGVGKAQNTLAGNILYSKNGIDWVSAYGTKMGKGTLYDVTYGDGKFVAVGSDGMVGCAAFLTTETTETIIIEPAKPAELVTHWNSELNDQMTISEGLEVDEETLSEVYPDIFTQLMQEMSKIEKDYHNFVGLSYASNSDIDAIMAGTYVNDGGV